MEYLVNKYVKIAEVMIVDATDENNNQINKNNNIKMLTLKRKRNENNENEKRKMRKKQSNIITTNISTMNLRSNCKGECGSVETGLPHFHHKHRKPKSIKSIDKM